MLDFVHECTALSFSYLVHVEASIPRRSNEPIRVCVRREAYSRNGIDWGLFYRIDVCI